MPSVSALDAVTIDAAGTLVELVDPTDRLRRLLAERGALREREAVQTAFAAEVAYYVPRSASGRDEEGLAGLRRAAVGVFLDSLAAEIAAEDFVEDFVGALEFRPIAGVTGTLRALRAAGLELACVANWDMTLDAHLERAGLAESFTAIVSSAAAGSAKPEPAIFLTALERLGVAPHRALHVGDDDADRDGAAAAGLAFEPAPLATLPERLGLNGAG